MNDGLLRLTACFGERTRVGGELLADALFDNFQRHRVRTSVLMRGIEGYGMRHHLRSDRLLTISEDLPVVAIALDRESRIREVLAELPVPPGRGVVTLERPRRAPAAEQGDAKLTVHLRRRQRAAGVPAFIAVCDLLRRHGVAGATALLGVDGTVAGSRRRARFLSANGDVPMMVIAVGEGAAIASAVEELNRLLDQPPATTEPVRVCKRDGEVLAPPGGSGWQRLTLYSSESATAGGHTVHRELVRRLRAAGAPGATSVRGIWGYHGEHAPHGDRLLQLRRRSPVLTTLVDEAARMPGWFEIADQLTPRRGLLTVEPVERIEPAPQPLVS